MDVLAIQKRRCNTVRQPSRPSGGSGYTLFPGHVIDEYNTPSVARDEFEGARLIGPFIISCINSEASDTFQNKISWLGSTLIFSLVAD